ncbi:MAG: hypothetical protein ACE5JU_25740 [Candidatus Binatia bacterium]
MRAEVPGLAEAHLVGGNFYVEFIRGLSNTQVALETSLQFRVRNEDDDGIAVRAEKSRRPPWGYLLIDQLSHDESNPSPHDEEQLIEEHVFDHPHRDHYCWPSR